MWLKSGGWVAANLAVMLAYVVAANLSYFLFDQFVVLFYPAAGVALAAVFYWGHRALPGIVLGSLLADSLRLQLGGLDPGGTQLLMNVAIALGAAAQAALGVALARRWFGAEWLLDEARQAVGLLLAIGPLSCWLNAGVGTAGLLLTSQIGPAELGETWLRWWLGDSNGVFSVGILLLAPRLLGSLRIQLVIAIISVVTVLIVGLQALTEYYLNRLMREDFSQRFIQLGAAFDDQVARHQNQLLALAAFMSSSDSVNPDTFYRFINTIGADHKQQPILLWAERVAAVQRAHFEQQLRLEYWPDFTITEVNAAGKTQPASVRAEYLPILYQSRPSAADRLFGVDMLATPADVTRIRHIAAEASLVAEADEGLLAPLLAAESATGHRVIALYYPVYEGDVSFTDEETRWAALRGIAISLIPTDAFLTRLQAVTDSQYLWFCWRDITNPQEVLTYAASPECTHGHTPNAPDRFYALNRQHLTQVGGRTWQLGAIFNPHNALLPYRPILIGLWMLVTSFLGGFSALVLLYARRSFYLEQVNDALQSRIQVVDHLNNQLQTRERRLRDMMDTAPAPIAVLGPSHRPEYLNPEFTTLLGYTVEDFPDAATWWHRLLPDPGYRDTVRAFWAEMEAAAQHGHAAGSYQAIVSCSWGEDKLVAINMSHSGESTTLVLTDLSERQRREAELQQAKDMAEQASLEKSQFLAMMSHEIRTPLHGLLGLLALVEDGGIVPTSRMYLQLARNAAESLQLLLDDILDFSKLESGRLALDNGVFLVQELVENVVTLQALNAEQKGLDLSWHLAAEVPRYLRGDALRLRQILQNLLSNAIKFTQTGVVRVEVNAEPQSGASVRLLLCIQDSGIGMTPEQQQKLFRPFTQADASITRRFGGSGLGLAIVAQLVALMRGQVWCESRVGYGSRFYVSLHLQVPSEAAIALQTTEQSETPTSSGLRLLLAEDNEINQILAVGVLRRQGHVVEVAPNGRLAVERWQETHFDAILMDVRMPEMDGLSATQEIRRLEQAAGQGIHTPIIAMTADAMPEDRVRCLQAGMDDYLAKPLRWPELAQLLSRHCRKTDASAPTGNPAPPRPIPPAEPAPADPLAHLRNPVEAKQLFFDDDELLYETTHSFVAQVPNFLERLNIAVEQQDLRRLREEAHAIKGVVSIFNAQEAKAAAYALECIARQAETAKIPEALTNLTAQLEAMRLALQDLLAQRPASGA